MNDFSDAPPFEDTPAEISPADIWENETQEPVLHPQESDLLESGELRQIGRPEELAEYWRHQGDTNDCALYSQGGVLEASGEPFDIEAYRQQGQEDGWYDPSLGTDIPAVGQIIEDNGVPVTYYDYGADFHTLAHELDQGHGVVTVVDTEPIWCVPGGHALWVTGMDVGDDGQPTSIICNDSGRPDGQAISYSADSFMAAWDLHNNYMVATQTPLVHSPTG